MKRLSFIVALLCALPLLSAAQEEPRDGVFIHLSHGQENPHRVAMAFRMAEAMSADKDVLMYCDITAINVVVKGAPDITFDHFPSVHKVMDELLKKGITIMACPGCMKVMGKTAEDLREGVKVAEKDAFFSFTKGRILTIDY